MRIKELNYSGIKCDNMKCDFRDDSVKSEEYEKWLNKPCPKCGENLLTQEDYDHVKSMLTKKDLFILIGNTIAASLCPTQGNNQEKAEEIHHIQRPYRPIKSWPKKTNIVLASNNPGKKKELQEMLGDIFRVYTMEDLGIDLDTIEDKGSLKENCLKKAVELKEYVPNDFLVLADDSGLFIDALNGDPGVYTARYAEDHNDDANMDKVLEKMHGISNRKAQFITMLCLIQGKEAKFFQGQLDLMIASNKRGINGFGYDPILEYKGKTLAEMTSEEKNMISHRAIAINNLVKHLEYKRKLRFTFTKEGE